MLGSDLHYISANPTFHHWQTGSDRYGLAFQSSADGRSFERSIRLAAHEIQKQRNGMSCRFILEDVA